MGKHRKRAKIRSFVNPWTLSVTTSYGPSTGLTRGRFEEANGGTAQIIASIDMGNRPKPITNGEMLPDGSLITIGQQQLIVSQPLKDGGKVITAYSVTYSAAGTNAYLNLEQTADGPAVVNGSGFGKAVAATGGQAVLAMPSCGTKGGIQAKPQGRPPIWNPGGGDLTPPDGSSGGGDAEPPEGYTASESS